MKKYDAIVVGSGCAGLSAALELITAGKKTLIIEKHNLPGGCATSFCRGRFEFEPSLHELCGIGPENNPGEIRLLMDRFGVKVDWQCVDDCFRCISTYSDGSPMDVTLPTGVKAFIDKTEEYVPGSREKMEKFFKLLEQLRDLIDYLDKPPKEMSPAYMIKNFSNVFKTASYSTEEVFEALELPQKCRDILAVYWSYLGVDMENLSFFHYAAMVYNYVARGAYIPAHTSHEISNAMIERFRALGGDVWFNCRAEEFLFDGDRCCGVKTNMGIIKADMVLANINPDIIYGKMVPKSLVPEREKKLSAARNRNFGARMFTVYLGLNKTAEELGIKDYSIFLADTADSVKEYESLKKIDTNNYSIFLCYNVANPHASPDGTAMCSFTTMFTASDDWDGISEEDYAAVKNKLAKKIIDNFEEKTGIKLTPYIEEISIASPWTFARYLGVPEGSVYGYLTAGWDSMLSRTVSQGADFPVKGLKPIGTSGIRGDGYSSTYMCGSIIAKTAIKELNEKELENMAFKINVGKSGFVDIKNLVKHITEKNRVLKATPAKEISAVFPINENAKRLHPDFQKMKISQVIEHDGAGAKTFVLSANKAAYFRAGQYLSVSLEIDGSVLTRPYSISSSPAWSKDGKYTITVRRTPNGFVSDWILDNWKVGDAVTVSEPLGNFFYEELRDAKDVIALAGGSGITPFLSMAYAIRDKAEDFNLTILFGSRNEDSILFKDELDSIARECDKVKVVHVLSEEEKDGYEHGFINAEIISKYAPKDREYSVFMCGPEAMYRFAEGEIGKLGLDRKYVRRELLGVTKKVWEKDGYPADAKGKTFSITVRMGEDEKVISASADEPVLVAIERAGIAAPSRCRSGECGWCRSKLVSGEIYVPEENDEGRRWSDKENGYIHPCSSFALSDLVMEVPATYITV